MDLKMEDLYVQCDECEGHGRTERRPNQQANQGSFGRKEVGRIGPCEKCNGAGGFISETGKVLLQFMKIMKSKGHL